jgi:DNA ligase 1
MLLQKSDQPFDSSDYITELKLDGIRLIYCIDDTGKVRLYSRHKNEVTSNFPELAALDIPRGTVLDGELIVSDKVGKPDFEAMMSRFMSSRDKTPVTFVAFDIIKHEESSVTSLPLINHKELLVDIVPIDTSILAKTQFIKVMARHILTQLKRRALKVLL